MIRITTVKTRANEFEEDCPVTSGRPAEWQTVSRHTTRGRQDGFSDSAAKCQAASLKHD